MLSKSLFLFHARFNLFRQHWLHKDINLPMEQCKTTSINLLFLMIEL